MALNMGIKERIQGAKQAITGKKDPTDRISGAFNRLQEEAGLTPLFKEQSMEARRKEVIEVLTELTNIEFQVTKAAMEKQQAPESEQEQHEIVITRMKQTENLQMYKLARMYQVFFSTGDPWVRGLDTPHVSKAVTSYIQLYKEVGHLPSFLPMLHSCSMQLLHLSWQKLDVDVMPPTLLSSQPIIAPANMQRVSLAGDGKQNQGNQPQAKTENL